MYIKELYLRNIRSYTEQRFYFRTGMTLLSGDIGSGKSTVLLSLEFALFGLIRGSINGGTLLRHGAKEGSVSLKFEINNEEYEVERGLKKTSTGIVQDKCFFVEKQERKPLTPVELKSRILELLGYPEDLVSRSKTLIFRYTVYTPQEEMKQIIFESKDERLEKLRRIFGVDKYELIKNNASNYARELKSEARVQGFLKEEMNDLSEEIKNLRTEINLLYEETDSLKKEKKSLNIKEKEIKEKEEALSQEVKKYNELFSLYKVLRNEVESLINKSKDLEEEIISLTNKVDEKEKELITIPEIKISSQELNQERKDIEEKKESVDKKINEARNKEAIIKNKVEEINSLLKKVHDLDNCPTCKQEVSAEHKEKLSVEEKTKLKKYEQKIKILNDFFEKAKNKKQEILKEREELEKKLEETRKLENKKELLLQKKKYVQENKEKLEELKEKKKQNEQHLKNKKEELERTKKELEKYEDLEKKIKEIKKDQQDINQEIINQEKKISANEQSIKLKQKNLEEKQEKQTKKEKELKELEQKKTLINWLSNHFTSLMSIIEKHVLAKIHKEFNALFREWFSMLIEDTELEANIEQDFSTSITQNGYDANIENLSGGEKTAVSLAYRLALNKVINDLVHEVKTKGLLILDEPTDGFSTEQLDRVRDVLEKTNTKQILIVSHEAKLESFVQNIIRINKQNHESQAIQM